MDNWHPQSRHEPAFVRIHPLATELRRRLLVPVTFALSALAAHAEPATPPSITDAWQYLGTGLFPEAKQGFSALSGPEAELGSALQLLGQQPKTSANIELAAERLRALAEREPKDEIAYVALYYLGRIAQVHQSTPSPETARGYYQKLIAAAPDFFLAESAVVKLAILDLYEVVSTTERRNRFESYRKRAAELRHAPARRDLSLLLADVALQFGFGEDIALENLLRADEAGITRTNEQATVMVRIGELARITGQHEIARTYYQRFLDTFRRDNRRTMIEERLAALPSQSSR